MKQRYVTSGLKGAVVDVRAILAAAIPERLIKSYPVTNAAEYVTIYLEFQSAHCRAICGRGFIKLCHQDQQCGTLDPGAVASRVTASPC